MDAEDRRQAYAATVFPGATGHDDDCECRHCSLDRARCVDVMQAMRVEAQAAQNGRPQRTFKVTVTVQGDTWEDAMRELHACARHVEDHGPECEQVTGGYSSSSIIDVRHDPAMTGDKYRDLVDEYLAEQREEDG